MYIYKYIYKEHGFPKKKVPEPFGLKATAERPNPSCLALGERVVKHFENGGSFNGVGSKEFAWAMLVT